ncbi:hypothetical protein JST97_19310 [bacterium]|nr:hypothetical protein [bacterium]
MILKPGTGTNPIYARKHGHEIPNTLDKVLAGLCPEYQPTGARNSMDAAEMLWKGEHVEFACGSHPAQATPPAPPKSYPTTYSNETYGSRTPAPIAAPTLPPPPPPVALADLEGILAPGFGWSEQDSQRQLQAIKHCPGASPQEVIRSAFHQSHQLDGQSFSKTGWSAGLTVASLVAGMGAIASALTNPGLALGLAGGALAGAGASALLVKSSHRDSNNSHILSDLGRRLDAKTWGQNYERHGSHGNYRADFLP